MRKAEVYRNGVLAGYLSETNNKFCFRYDENYLNNRNCPAISLTMPKTEIEYTTESMFPFFFNMLSEGVNRKLQSFQLKIDENDHFGLLIQTARFDTVGAITVKPID